MNRSVTRSGPGRLELVADGAVVEVKVGVVGTAVGCNIPSFVSTGGTRLVASRDRHPARTTHLGYRPGPRKMLLVGTSATGPYSATGYTLSVRSRPRCAAGSRPGS
jgi:hypothetical protein